MRLISFLSLSTLFVGAGLVMAVPMCRAQEDVSGASAIGFQKEIIDYNRIKPLQNPRYEQSSDILKRRIIDSKSKVIGEVQDLLFDRNGRVSSLYVIFDRLKLNQSVYLNYGTLDIKSMSDGYRLGFNSDEVETLYPALLSGIEAASSKDTEDNDNVFSLKSLLGTTVIDSDSIIIGNLQDVFFDNNGAYVRSVYLNINHSNVHNKGVAVPLSVLTFKEKDGKTYIVIDKEYVSQILEMARKG